MTGRIITGGHTIDQQLVAVHGETHLLHNNNNNNPILEEQMPQKILKWMKCKEMPIMLFC
jgi:hypothetical protein